MSAKPSGSRGDGVPLGAGSPDEPAHTLPAEPRQITKAQAPKAAASQPASRTKRPGNEEPELALEEDVPSDGKDEKGEAMIRSLARQTEKKAKKEK